MRKKRMPAYILVINPALSEEPRVMLGELPQLHPQPQPQPQMPWFLVSDCGYSDENGCLQDHETAIAVIWGF
jgi:hypothetical protein